jgi:hypothetical protein
MDQTVNFSASNIIISVVMIVIFAVIGVVIHRSTKSKTDVGMGFLGYLVKQELFLLTLIVLVLITGEAGLVASFHPADLDERIPEMARFISHWGINLAGFIATVNVPKKIAELIFLIPNPLTRDPAIIAARRKDKDRSKKIILLLFYSLLSLGISLFLPAVNVYMLASGVGQVQQLEFLWSEWFSNIDMAQVYANTPVSYLQATHINDGREFLGEYYSPFKDFKYPLLLVFVAAFTHYAIAMLEGVASAIAYYGTFTLLNAPAPARSSGSSSGSSSSSSAPNPDRDPIALVLEFYGYEGVKLTDKIAESLEKLDSIRNDAHKANIGAKIAALYDKVEDIQTRQPTMTRAEWTREARRLRSTIRDTFRSPHTSGAGLGITLSNAEERNGMERDKDLEFEGE